MPSVRCALAVVGTAWVSDAFAYRSFDSTDPAVANVGEFEIELSPVSFRHHDSGETWITPQLRLNYGFAENWEVVLEGEGEHARSARSTLVGNALAEKHLAGGSLQDKSGLSLATEIGLLLPGVNDESGTGATLAAIAGQRYLWGGVHSNVAASLSREKRSEVFIGTIIEGPLSWVVRPVAEVIYGHEFGLNEEAQFSWA